MTPKPRRCDQCRADAEQNYLRMTQCLDGELRKLCEHCALEIEEEKRKASAERAARRAS